MPNNKQNQEINVVGRFISFEVLAMLLGAVSLVYGLVAGRFWNIMIGALIVAAAVVLIGKCRSGRR
jgi:ABC-type Mn2+/Zn2+ transport system permease subunit